MPRCKNDQNRYYKGTEPSPKGKGFCAHACKVSQRKKGQDGKMWVVVSRSGRKRWVRTEVLRKKKLAAKKKTTTKRTAGRKKPRQKALRGGANHMLTRTVLPEICALTYVNANIKQFFRKYINCRYTDEKIMTIIENTIQSLSGLPKAKDAHSDIALTMNMFKTMQSLIQSARKMHISTGSSSVTVIPPHAQSFVFRSANNGPSFTLTFDPNLTVKQLKDYIFKVKKLKVNKVVVPGANNSNSKVLDDQTVFKSVHPEKHRYIVLVF